MYFYTLNDFVMAARVFHSVNISELVEATDLEDHEQRAERAGIGEAEHEKGSI